MMRMNRQNERFFPMALQFSKGTTLPEERWEKGLAGLLHLPVSFGAIFRKFLRVCIQNYGLYAKRPKVFPRFRPANVPSARREQQPAAAGRSSLSLEYSFFLSPTTGNGKIAQRHPIFMRRFMIHKESSSSARHVFFFSVFLPAWELRSQNTPSSYPCIVLSASAAFNRFAA